MAKLTRADFMERLKTFLGEDTSDEALTLLEDANDSFEEGDGVDWKQRYEENDKEWRQKYKDRFFNKSEDDNDDDIDEPEEKKSFTDLFKTE